MKNLLFTGVLLLITLGMQENVVAQAEKGSAGYDTNFLINYYEETFNELQKSLEGLSAEQMQYSPSDVEWSISECIEHIILTEKMLFGMNRDLMNTPANTQRRAELQSDEDIIRGVTDRSKKAQTMEELIGKNRYSDPKTAMKDLEILRREIADYIRSQKPQDFRDRITDSPFGPIDGYQSLLFLAAHTARHTQQIEEIKDVSGFYLK